MLLSSNKHLLLELSPNCLRLVPPAGEPVQQMVSAAEWWPSLERLLDQPAYVGARLTVVLSNQLVHFTLHTLDAKLKEASAQQQFMAHHLSQLYGGQSASWQCRLFLNKSGLPSLIAGLEQSWLQQLTALISKKKLILEGVIPLLAKVFNAYQRSLKQSSAWLVIYEPGYSLLVLLQAGVPVYCSGVHHHNLAELPQLLARESLLLPEPVASPTIYLYTSELQPALAGVERLANIAAHKLPRALPMTLDFRQQSPVSRRAGWLLLLVGITLFGEMLWSYQQLLGDLDAASQQHELLPSSSQQTKTKPSSANVPVADAWQGMLQQLQRPWPEFFSGLESIQNPDIAILHLQHNPRNQTVRLQGEARNYAALLTFVGELNNTPPFADASLTHHEIRTDQPQQPVAFDLTLRWVQTP